METILTLLSALGGLAVLLCGMNLMSSNLKKLSGNKLEGLLEKMTDKPIKGIALGAMVTAIIQSSGATTVMAVGFVNSGILTLYQSIGVIMGANIGTTITSWILSLAGISDSSLWVEFIKPTTFAPVLALIGVFLLIMSKNDRRKTAGGVLLGFGFLLVGMSTMSQTLKPFASEPAVQNILMMFTNPFLGILAGAAVTVMVQSSAASVGILQAFSLAGAVTYSNAIPIVMGQNIGTCVQALFSCIGATKNAKRAAMVHFYFNAIGSLLLLSIYYIVVHVAGLGDFVNQKIGPENIAVIHTAFNIINTIIFLPFTKLLGKLAELTIRDRRPEESTKGVPQLDMRFMQSPTFAVEHSKKVVFQMGELAQETLSSAIKLRSDYSPQLAEEISENEQRLDRYEDELGTYLVKLGGQEISKHSSSEVSLMLHAIGDFERIGDHAVNIMESAAEMRDKGLRFSGDANDELTVIERALTDIVSLTMRALTDSDFTVAKQVEPLEQVIDDLQGELRKRHFDRLKSQQCTIELGFVFTDLITNYERIADHCSNLAAALIESNENAFNTHDYLHTVKEESPDFIPMVKQLKQEYILP